MFISHDDLKMLIGSRETLFVEWKSDHVSGFNDSVVINSCIALANAEGGELFIGIEDKTGRIIGSKRALDKQADEKSLEGLICSRTMPNLLVSVTFLSLSDGKNVVRIQVPKSPSVIGTTDGRYLKRRIMTNGEPANMPMTPDEIFRNTTSIGFVDLSANLMSRLTMDDIDIDLVQYYSDNLLKKNLREEEKEIFSQSPVDVLKTLGLVNVELEPNIAAVLLFGKNDSLIEKLPNHFVQYQVFGDGGEVLKNEKLSWPIVKLLPYLLSLPELVKNTDEILVKGRSVVVPEYSVDALREAFANALVHRDYSLYSGIQIQVFSDSLRIVSAGGFVRGVSLDKLLRTPPIPRNRRLAEAMRMLKMVETSGRGIDKIYYYQARYGRPAPDYSSSTDNYVEINISGGRANLDFCKFIFDLDEDVKLFEMLILNYLFYHRSATIADLVALIQGSVAEVRKLTQALLEKRLIELIDEGNPIFFLKGKGPKIVVRLNDENILEYETKICSLLSEHGRMSRNDIARYVGLSSTQAYRVLIKMQQSGKVKQDAYKWRLN